MLDGQGFSFLPDHALMIFPNQFHHYLNFSKAGMNWLFITFELPDIKPVMSLKDSVVLLNNYSKQIAHNLSSCFTTHQPATGKTCNRCILLTALLLHELLLLAGKSNPTGPENQHLSNIAYKVNMYVNANLSKSISLPDIARHVALSPSRLRTVYKEEVGLSIATYIREMKMNRAKALLNTSEMNVSLVGEACGYESVYAFSRAFSNAVGMPPRKYKQMNKSAVK